MIAVTLFPTSSSLVLHALTIPAFVCFWNMSGMFPSQSFAVLYVKKSLPSPDSCISFPHIFSLFLKSQLLDDAILVTLSKTSVLLPTLYIPFFPALCFSPQHLSASNILHTLLVPPPSKQKLLGSNVFCPLYPGACCRAGNSIFVE